VLVAKNIKQLRPNRKLSDKYLGPFEVELVVGDHRQAYRLKLPPHFKIHNVFHVSLLEPWEARQGNVVEPGPIQVHDQLEYEVKSIQADRDTENSREYLVSGRDILLPKTHGNY